MRFNVHGFELEGGEIAFKGVEIEGGEIAFKGVEIEGGEIPYYVSGFGSNSNAFIMPFFRVTKIMPQISRVLMTN